MVTALAYRFASKEPAVCGICRRRAVWVGYAPLDKWMSHRGPVVWLCGDEICSQVARKTYAMPTEQLDAYEEAAALEAGAQAAHYLEQCGTTDLAKLTEPQWQEFLRRLLTGFEQTLRSKILDGEAPF